MKLLNDIEQFLTKAWGKDYFFTKTRINNKVGAIGFSKPIESYPTVLMVVQPPVGYNFEYNNYYLTKNKRFKFFLYDMETEMVFGKISDIELADDWGKLLFYKIRMVEDELERSICPDCGFWLLERVSKSGHNFIGCSGYPDCTFCANSNEIYEKEDFELWKLI